MLWKPFAYRGRLYDLSHLHPCTVLYEQPATQQKPPRRYTVRVLYGLHCFTKGIHDLAHANRELNYSDARETRQFDFERYELSKQLPKIIQGLPARKCFHTGNPRGNFFSVEVLDRDGKKVEYDIFFSALRSKTTKGVVDLVVETAFVRDAQHLANRPRKKPIGFLIILYNTLNSRKISVQK